ncbi:GNAT family N-acetyltransferase [Phenylobacterium sp.]|uniref:GNAT family N-acetyltransferase n=1 Tax=Phenylobacterium sp. TaxID=1871053 RepID=UPI002732938D|nr:GNAT family N-acetyltransferase [Phenylobacterium sp.]MDP3855460.1 GNAT family N-acetyltransferase [Phenylobacterium sp.]
MCAIEIEPGIRTQRLRLRRPRRADAARIAEYCNDFDVAKMTSQIPHPYGIADAHAFIDRQDYKDPAREVTFAIEHPEEGFMGILGFFGNAEGRSEIGYWLGRPHWGKGYATEAADRALVWASREWGRRYVVAGHACDNPASGEVLCKVGFLYTGEVKLLASAARKGETPVRMMVWLA